MTVESQKDPAKTGDKVAAAPHAHETTEKAGESESKPLASAPSAVTRDEQKKVFSQDAVASNTADLVAKAKLPDCSIHHAESSADAGDRQGMIGTVQQILLDRLALITPPPAADQASDPNKQADAYIKVLKDRQADIKAEMGDDAHAGVWGKATQAAFKDYVEYVQNGVPLAIANLTKAGLPLPPGSPISVPVEHGHSIGVDDYKTRVVNGTLKADFNVDTCVPPNVAEAQKLLDAENWTSKSGLATRDASDKRLDEDITKYITDHGLPKSWLYQDGENKEVWRVAANTLVGMVDRVGYSLQVIDKLKLPIEPPPGTKITKTDGGQLHIDLDIPQGSRLSDPANMAKITRLVSWADDAREKIDQAMKDDRKSPIAEFAYGDTSVPNFKDPNDPEKTARALARLDQNGNLIGIFNPFTKDKDPLKPGETTVEMNQIEQRLSVRQDANGDIVAQQYAQAQDAPWYAWYWPSQFSKDVGKPAQIPEQRFTDPKEIVKVVTPSGADYIMASDLPSFAASAALRYHGENLLGAVADGAMLVPGLSEFSLAGKATYAAAKGADIALNTLARAAGRAAFDTAAGSTGFMGAGAWWDESEQRQSLASWRGRIFVAGAARHVLEALPATDRLLANAKGAHGDLDEFASPLEKKAVKASQMAMGASQLPTLASVGENIAHSVGTIVDPQDPLNEFYGHEAYNQLQRLQPPERTNEQLPGRSDQEDAQHLQRTVDEYQQLYTRGLSHASERTGADAPAVQTIFDHLRDCIGAAGTPEGQAKVDAFKTELVHNLFPYTAYELSELQRAQGHRLSKEDLISSIQHDPPSDESAAHAYSIAKELRPTAIDKDERATVSALALLWLSNLQNGNDQTKPIASAKLLVENSAQFATRNKQMLDMSINASDLTPFLQGKLERSDNDGRATVIAETLMKAGAMSAREDGAVLQNVLNNPKATSLEKLSALSSPFDSRLGAIAATLWTQENDASLQNLSDDQRMASRARGFGTSSADLENTLARVAATDSDPGVRAASALNYYSLKRLHSAPAEGLQNLKLVADSARNYAEGKYPSLAADTTGALLDQLKDSSAQRRLDASDALLALTKSDAPQDAGRIKSAIAASLSDTFNNGTDVQSLSALDAMTPDLVQRLKQDNPDALHTMRSRVIAMLGTSTSYNAEEERCLVKLMSKMPVIMDGADANMRGLFYEQSKGILLQSPASYYDLRSATADALSTMAFKDAIDDGTLATVAGRDPYATARLSAVKAYAHLAPTRFSADMRPLAAQETDLAVKRELLSLGSQLSHAPFAGMSEMDNFVHEVKARYPKAQQFDASQQSAWIDANAPLLNPNTFTKSVQNATKGKADSWPWEIAQAGNRVADERHDQFQSVLDMAQGSIDDEKTQQARRLLLSIIKADIHVASPSANIPIGEAQIPFTDESIFGPQYETKYYSDQGANWSNEAAKALAETAKIGSSGRDLTAELIHTALASNVQGEARETLLKAWSELSAPYYGLSAVPVTHRSLTASN